MNGVLQILAKGRVEEILRELSLRFKLPLLLADAEDRPVISCGLSAEGANAPARPKGHTGKKVPIRFRGDTVGSISTPLSGEAKGALLEAAAYCLENSLRLESEIEDLSSEVVRVYEELSLLYSISNKLGGEMDIDSICQRVLEDALRILPVQNISIMLLDNLGQELYTRRCIGRDRDAAGPFRADASSGLVRQMLEKGRAFIINDLPSFGSDLLPYPARAVLCVPLVTDGRNIGMLLASDKLSGEEFRSQELKLMDALASEVAVAIKKAQLYDDISRLFMHTVEALASAIDAKDPYTYGHSQRVARLSSAICGELGMSGKEVKKVELAAILHDIGKIGTPESILQKPGKLGPEELEKVHEHPSKGARILSNIRELADVIQWIRHHHEWYDGEGYPDHLAAEGIPVQARVIAIADAFDAMTSDRPYRKGMPAGEAIKIMESFTGSQFDPHILEAFKRVFSTGQAGLVENERPGGGTPGRG